MSEKRFWTLVLALVCSLVLSVAAQDEKNEIGVTVGRSMISTQRIQGATFFDPFIRYGKGLSFNGSYARRILYHDVYAVSGEIPVMYNIDEDLHAGGPGLVPKDYSALFVAPSFRVNLFPTTAVSPWGSIGGGFGHISENAHLLYSPPNPNPGKSKTTGVFQYGIGLDVRFWRKLYLRGEARDFWADQADFPLSPTGKTRQHNYFVGGGAFWRF